MPMPFLSTCMWGYFCSQNKAVPVQYGYYCTYLLTFYCTLHKDCTGYVHYLIIAHPGVIIIIDTQSTHSSLYVHTALHLTLHVTGSCCPGTSLVTLFFATVLSTYFIKKKLALSLCQGWGEWGVNR